MKTPPTPFKILALAPLKVMGGRPWDSSPLRIDKDNITEVMRELGISFFVHLPKDLHPAGGMDIRCFKPKDFHPDGMIQSNEFLKNLAEARRYIEKAGREGLSPDQIESGLQRFSGIPSIKIEAPPKKSSKKEEESLDSLLNMVALPGENNLSTPSYSKPSGRMEAIFRQIFHEIFSDDDFRRIESAWRGVNLILEQGCVGENIILEVVPVDVDALEDALAALTPELVQDLPSLILLDLPFDSSSRSLELLEAVAAFSETLMAPSIVWISHQFFHLASWDELRKLSYLPHLIDEPHYAKWRNLRGSQKANWMTAVCNRFLHRYPYGPDNRVRFFDFKEPHLPWITPVWAAGALLGQSAEKFGWPTRLSDWSEIRLQDLALFSYDQKNPLSTEIYLTEDRIQQLLLSGITPLVGQKRQDIAFIPAETTIAGESLCYQLFLTCATQFIIWSQDNLSEALEGEELEQRLKQVLTGFLEKGGFAGAEYVEVKAGAPVENNRIPVHISIKPVRRVLTSGRKVELDILW